MLINCPECTEMISDKAVSCPRCGFPIMKNTSNRKHQPKKRMRLPNGFGRIQEIKGRNLRKPFRARICVGFNELGKPIVMNLKPEAYFETYNDAYAALLEYHKNPYDLKPDITVKELYDKWTESYFKEITESAARTIKCSWAYCSSIQSMRAKDIRTRHIKGIMEEGFIVITSGKNKGEVKHASANTKSRIKSLFNLMFDYALEYEIVDHNYARDFELSNGISEEIETGRKGHEIFTDDEINVLWEHVDDTLYVDIILFQCYTGLRPQELGLIEVSKINLTEWYMYCGIKTKAGINRLVPIHTKIRSILQRKYNEAIAKGSMYLFTTSDTITHKNSDMLTYDKYRTRFKNVISSLKLNENHRAHDPRKHFITICKKAGVDDNVIKLIVGHAISDITEKIYTQRDIEWLHRELAKIK